MTMMESMDILEMQEPRSHESPPLEGFRLSPQQSRLSSLQRVDPRSVFGAIGVLRIRGRLRAHLLHSALRAVVERHEILRTTFHRPPGLLLPVQVVGAADLLWGEDAVASAEQARERIAEDRRHSPD